jgi:hypothetical protein
MDIGNLEIKPIKVDEWLPDRCLVWDEPFDPRENEPQAGCASLDRFCTHGSRSKLEDIYKEAIDSFNGCGFVVWEKKEVIAYHTFFPREIAQNVQVNKKYVRLKTLLALNKDRMTNQRKREIKKEIKRLKEAV